MKKYLLSILCITTVVCACAQADYQAILTKTERDVIPEGIVVNPADGKIYVSSIALQKIIAINANGTHEDFIKTNNDGFLEGLGMKIDEKKQWLWVASNQRQGKWTTSQIHAFDLKTKSTQQKYVIKDTVRHLFNDLILHANGKVYVTDTYASALYEIDPVQQKLNLIMQGEVLYGINGIVQGAADKIYIAVRDGLLQFNPASKEIIPLTYKDAAKKAFWMDGMVYWKNSIIGVSDYGIVQYQLNAAGNQIESERFIDQTNKYFHEPTTAALFSNKLYVIANSHLAAYNQNNESVKGIADKLGPVVIVVYTLSK